MPIVKSQVAVSSICVCMYLVCTVLCKSGNRIKDGTRWSQEKHNDVSGVCLDCVCRWLQCRPGSQAVRQHARPAPAVGLWACGTVVSPSFAIVTCQTCMQLSCTLAGGSTYDIIWGPCFPSLSRAFNPR